MQVAGREAQRPPAQLMFFTRVPSGQKKPERHSMRNRLGLLGGKVKFCAGRNCAESGAEGSTQYTINKVYYTSKVNMFL